MFNNNSKITNNNCFFLSIHLIFQYRTFKREEVTQILKEFYPFINPCYLPINLKNKTLLNENENYDNVQEDLSLDEGKKFIYFVLTFVLIIFLIK